MKKAVQTVSQLYDERTSQVLQSYFERIQTMPGARRLFNRISNVWDRNQLDDYLAEVWYALVFAGLGFQVEIEPLGKDGPDLGVSRDNHYAVVEIMRFRKIYPGPPELDLSDESTVFPGYGDPPRDIRKAFEKILMKFRQVQNSESIIAIWNDDEDLEELEVDAAVAYLRSDAAQGVLTLPSGLLFVLYGSKWIGTNRKQLYCFPLHYPVRPHQATWQGELESFTVNELIRRALTQSTDSVI